MKKILSMLLVGVLLIGIGSGICVFEFASYSYGQQPTDGAFASTRTNVISALPATDQTIYFDDSYGYNEVTLAVDDTLGNEVRLEVTGPGQLLKYHINRSDNTLHFYYEPDPFKITAAILESAKHKLFFDFTPKLSMTLYANSENAKRIVLGEDPAIKERRDSLEEMREEYQNSLTEQQDNYESNLDELRTNYQEQIDQLNQNLREERQTHQEELNELRQQYQEQIDQLNEELREAHSEA